MAAPLAGLRQKSKTLLQAARCRAHVDSGRVAAIRRLCVRVHAHARSTAAAISVQAQQQHVGLGLLGRGAVAGLCLGPRLPPCCGERAAGTLTHHPLPLLSCRPTWSVWYTMSPRRPRSRR